jgi:hypothetical protein
MPKSKSFEKSSCALFPALCATPSVNFYRRFSSFVSFSEKAFRASYGAMVGTIPSFYSQELK